MGYGSIIQSKTDEETQDLLNSNDDNEDETRQGPSISESLNCRDGVVLGLFVILSSMIILYLSLTKDDESMHNIAPQGWIPDEELGLQGVIRAEDASPSEIWGNKTNGPLPTNSWYLNLVSHHAENPDDSTKVYTVPYIVDTAADNDMKGLTVHWPVMQSNDRNVQMVHDFKNGISMGTFDIKNHYKVDEEEDLSALGVTLRWMDNDENSDAYMKSHIVRGMPYATMIYAGGVRPTFFSHNAPASNLVADNNNTLECGQLEEDGTISNSTTFTIEKKLKFHVINSDFTWMAFFSAPIEMECGVESGDEKLAALQINVKNIASEEPLVVRLALIDQCTTGKANIQLHCSERAELLDRQGYIELLEQSSGVFPTSPKINFEYPKENSKEDTAFINFDWAAETSDDTEKKDLIMFALPHQQEQMQESTTLITEYCMSTFHGSSCLIKGDKWSLAEDLSQRQSFTAKRPPAASAIGVLAYAVSKDIDYRLSDNLHRGAADTYFSGKLLARVARSILVAQELKDLAEATELENKYDVDEKYLQASIEAASAVSHPSDMTIRKAVEDLKECVQVWLEDAEAPYLYDKSWGGLVNCGCRYSGKGEHGFCNNTYPDCPALVDVNEDFGNGYYNDHHFHYGYHVYAAATVAKFDPEWGKEYFDMILLYIRDYANPWESDQYFTPFRQKDWWLGSSWASGIVSAENSPHGRNEESSSEAIAAYESMALFGQVMTDALESEGGRRLETAMMVRDAGELLTITEIEAANRYWHVWDSKTHKSTYPKAYTKPVVGMLYETMASFQTWFSPYAVVSYGIQLLPFTPVGELRDDPEWASILYPEYEESCKEAGDFCVKNGWDIIQAGLCATAGNFEEAMDQVLALSDTAFDSEGGEGNSLSNTIWYISTRPN